MAFPRDPAGGNLKGQSSPLMSQPQSLVPLRHHYHESRAGALLCKRRNQTEEKVHLNGNVQGCSGAAPCAFKGAQIKTGFVRLDAGQPHRVAASRAVQNSELRNTKNWIVLSRQHDTTLKIRRERDTLSHRLLP